MIEMTKKKKLIFISNNKKYFNQISVTLTWDFSHMMYKGAPRLTGLEAEFIELVNDSFKASN